MYVIYCFRKRDLLYIFLCHGLFSGNNRLQWRLLAKLTDETTELIGIRSKFPFAFSHKTPKGKTEVLSSMEVEARGRAFVYISSQKSKRPFCVYKLAKENKKLHVLKKLGFQQFMNISSFVSYKHPVIPSQVSKCLYRGSQ